MNVWVEAARPRTLPAGVVPVLVGSAAAVRFSAWRAAAALVVGVAIQVAVNYANDYFDGVRGVDTPARVGPRRAVASGVVTAGAMRRAMVLAFAVAAVAGLALASAVGWPLLLLGAVCVVAALGYSGGPRPYASQALGEVAVFVFFGLVATVGAQYVQDERVRAVAVAAALPVGLLATAILVVNNLRDVASDAAAGKVTLAVRLGAPATRTLYVALVVLAFVAVVTVAVAARSPWPALAGLAAAAALGPVAKVRRADATPADLVGALGQTGRLHLVFGVLLAGGLALA